jgi:hypothetical protein
MITSADADATAVGDTASRSERKRSAQEAFPGGERGGRRDRGRGRDGGETETEDEEDEESALRPDALRQSRALHSEEGEGEFEAGIITRVHMTNFMCHRLFDVKLGLKMNFITGQNGSGKSAIVAAIQLCLGATAKRTGRGDSLSRLIREGSTSPAVVRVTLLNKGLDAYKHAEYGDSITIERKIAKTGSAGYRLLDHEQKKVDMPTATATATASLSRSLSYCSYCSQSVVVFVDLSA